MSFLMETKINKFFDRFFKKNETEVKKEEVVAILAITIPALDGLVKSFSNRLKNIEAAIRESNPYLSAALSKCNGVIAGSIVYDFSSAKDVDLFFTSKKDAEDFIALMRATEQYKGFIPFPVKWKKEQGGSYRGNPIYMEVPSEYKNFHGIVLQNPWSASKKESYPLDIHVVDEVFETSVLINDKDTKISKNFEDCVLKNKRYQVILKKLVSKQVPEIENGAWKKSESIICDAVQASHLEEAERLIQEKKALCKEGEIYLEGYEVKKR